MRIGIDTLFEDPIRGSSAVDYIVSLIATLPEVDRTNEFFVFSSGLGRRVYQNGKQPHFQFVICGASNERRSLRLVGQQTLLPYLCARHGIDVLYSPGNVRPLALSCASVVKMSSFHHYYAPSKIGIFRTMYRRVMFGQSARHADKIIANSESTKSDICRFTGVPSSKVVLVPESVDDCFSLEVDPAALRVRLKDRFDLVPGYVLFVSALYRYKNPDGVIRAFAKLRREDDLGIPLVIVGSDPDGFRKELAQLVHEQGLDDRVRFAGRVPNEGLIDLYRGAGVLAYPSFSETFGKPLVEAMRCGTPVVASNAGSIPEVLAGAGLTCDPGDVDCLAHNIRLVLTDERLRRRLIEAGLRRGADFSWQRHAADTLAVCVEVGRSHESRTVRP